MPYDASIPGWMKESELMVLEQLAMRVPSGKKVVEIGSFLGRSAVAWAATAPDCEVYCIDTWAQSWEELVTAGIDGNRERFEGPSIMDSFSKLTAPYKNIRGLKGPSTKEWDLKDCEVVFVDGDHTGEAVWADLEFWWGRVSPTGLLCGHDFYSEYRFTGLVQAVVGFAAWKGLSLFVPRDTSLWMLFKSEEHMNRWWMPSQPSHVSYPKRAG